MPALAAIEGNPALFPPEGSNPRGETPLLGTSVSAPNRRTGILNPSPLWRPRIFGLVPHARHLRGLRSRVAVAAPQLAVLRVPELRGEGVAGGRRGRGGRRLLQQQQHQDRQKRHRSHGWAGREGRGTPALASAEDAAAARTRLLTSPKRGSLGSGGGDAENGRGSALRHCLGAGRWIAALAVCPICGCPDTFFLSTGEGISA